MSIQNSLMQCVSYTVEVGKIVITDWVTFDRSGQKFYADTITGRLRIRAWSEEDHIDAVQLKGRNQQICSWRVLTVVISLIFAFFLTYALTHGGGLAWTSTGIFGFLGGVSLKESILQSYAFYKEQKASQIKDSEETRYDLRDFVHATGTDIKEEILRLLSYLY